MLKKFLGGIFFSKKGVGVRTYVRTSKVIYARTRTHIFKNFPAPICTKIAAPALGCACTHLRARF